MTTLDDLVNAVAAARAAVHAADSAFVEARESLIRAEYARLRADDAAAGRDLGQRSVARRRRLALDRVLKSAAYTAARADLKDAETALVRAREAVVNARTA